MNCVTSSRWSHRFEISKVSRPKTYVILEWVITLCKMPACSAYIMCTEHAGIFVILSLISILFFCLRKCLRKKHTRWLSAYNVHGLMLQPHSPANDVMPSPLVRSYPPGFLGSFRQPSACRCRWWQQDLLADVEHGIGRRPTTIQQLT